MTNVETANSADFSEQRRIQGAVDYDFAAKRPSPFDEDSSRGEYIRQRAAGARSRRVETLSDLAAYRYGWDMAALGDDRLRWWWL